MSTRLEHKTALVTGATSNIGRAIATAFAAEGAHVIVSGRSPQRGAEVLEQIHAAGGHAEFIAADLDGSAQVSGASLPTPPGRSADGSTCSSTARESFRAQPR
jgi:NAD(P)-dependent dehydrogenase (short-subunit alcohol dehydrogenase family)